MFHEASEFVSRFQKRRFEWNWLRQCFHRCISSLHGAGCLPYASMWSTHTHKCELFPHPHSNPYGLKPCRPHINEATPIFHHGRCVAIATRPFHLWFLIEYAYSIWCPHPLLDHPSTPPKPSQSSHFSLIALLWLACSSHALLQSIDLHTRLTVEWQLNDNHLYCCQRMRKTEEGWKEWKGKRACCMYEYHTIKAQEALEASSCWKKSFSWEWGSETETRFTDFSLWLSSHPYFSKKKKNHSLFCSRKVKMAIDTATRHQDKKEIIKW